MKKLNSKGFSPVEIILILLLLLLLAGGGYYVYQAKNKNNQKANNTSQQQSQAQIADKKTEEPKAEDKYLEIKEWNIKFKLTSNIEDAYYDNIKTTAMNAFSLRVHSLDSEPDCKNGSQSIVTIFKVDKDEPDDRVEGKKYSETNATQGKLIGNYFYFMGRAQYFCTENAVKKSLLEKVSKEFIDAGTTIISM